MGSDRLTAQTGQAFSSYGIFSLVDRDVCSLGDSTVVVDVAML